MNWLKCCLLQLTLPIEKFCLLFVVSRDSFRNTIRVSNSLDLDQVQHFVGPDLGSNCFQNLSGLVDKELKRILYNATAFRIYHI